MALLLFSGLAADAVLAHDLGLVYPSLSRVVLDRLPDDTDRNTALAAFRDYLYLTIGPFGNPPDQGPTEVLLTGYGYCNQVADVSIRMVEPLDVRGYVVFLNKRQGRSPHTVALLTPDEPTKKPIKYLRKQARVYDCIFGLTYRTRWGGAYSTPNQICRGNYQLQRHNLTTNFTWFCQRPKVVRANRPLSRQGWFQRRTQGLIRTAIPPSWMRAMFRLVVGLDLSVPAAERAYYLARIDHLYLRYGPARRAYDEVIKRYPDTDWAVLARQHRRRLSALSQKFPPGGGYRPGR